MSDLSTPSPKAMRPRSIALACTGFVVFLLLLGFGYHEVTKVNYSTLAPSQKVAYISRQLRAPGDPDTVASSNLGEALRIRYEVSQDVAKGLSYNQIVEAMENEYGPNVLAVPRFRGFGALTFVVPVCGILVVIGAVMWFLASSVKRNRWQQSTVATSAASGSEAGSAAEASSHQPRRPDAHELQEEANEFPVDQHLRAYL